MSKSFQTGAGNKVKVFVALLPLGSRVEPVNVTVTSNSSGIANSGTTITVTALSGPIAGGTPLEFSNGSSTLVVYLSQDAPAGATTLNIEAAAAALTGVCTATYTAKQRLAGGTQTGAQFNTERTESLVFEDPLGYSDGVATSASWTIPWTANLLAADFAYRRVAYAAINGISGREVFIWQEDPPPSGATTGDTVKGATIVTDFSKEFPSDGKLLYAA